MGSEGVKFFANLSDAEIYLNTLNNPDEVLIQQKIGNKAVRAGCFLFQRGRLISFYAHERIRTFPSAGGVTVCSVSIDDERVMELGNQLLGSLNWSGFAMIGVMWSDRLGDYQMIELTRGLGAQ